MLKIFFSLFLIIFIVYSECYEIIWDNTVEYDFNNFGEYGRLEEVRMPNWFFIFPGTKWCGVGNIAEGDSDYGVHRQTDKCCRNHDLCPDIIEAYQSKYNLTNPYFYSKLNCACDKEFYKCLKSINTNTATQVGHLYFTVLGTQCYANTYPVKECRKYTYFPKKKCIEYLLDDSQDQGYQWFDLPNF